MIFFWSKYYSDCHHDNASNHNAIFGRRMDLSSHWKWMHLYKHRHCWHGKNRRRWKISVIFCSLVYTYSSWRRESIITDCVLHCGLIVVRTSSSCVPTNETNLIRLLQHRSGITYNNCFSDFCTVFQLKQLSFQFMIFILHTVSICIVVFTDINYVWCKPTQPIKTLNTYAFVI